MFRTLSIAVAVMLAMQQKQDTAVPKTAATTPAGCLQELRDYAAKRQQDVIAETTPKAGTPATIEASLQLSQARAPLIAQINQTKAAMAAECALRLDTPAVPAKDLVSLADLYNEASQPDKVKSTIGRALAVKSLSAADRAAALLYGVRAGLREPKTDERNARLEKYVSELDASAAATIEQKLDAHIQMNSWYRYDDVDAGIIKHSSWIIATARKLTPDQRRKFGAAAVNAYVNLAEAWAGQGLNDKALALLRSTTTELKDIPNVARSVDPQIARLLLVGTAGPALTAPRWLNMPAGKTELPMPGAVTLLEFSAHWCTPCKESYPGINRLRQKYGKQGFRVVLATQLYGYFDQERNLAPQEEFERDRKYYAEHGMDVPIAVGDRISAAAPNSNDTNYKVGGIPQIHLIDKKGRIRLVMVGYDDANEPKLANMIEGLLKEN
jgi:thiol-disulfide isomerase/thioredoxin